MSKRTRNLLRGISVLLVILAVLIQLEYVSIIFLDAYRFWMLIIAYAMLLLTSK